MNPNSAHQEWSQWTFVVTCYGPSRMPLALLQAPAAAFMRSLYGTAAQMKIDQRAAVGSGGPRDVWTLTVQAEGARTHDLAWRQHVRRRVGTWARHVFGRACHIDLDVRLLAGDPEDGRPPTQWLVMPTAPMMAETTLWGQHGRRA